MSSCSNHNIDGQRGLTQWEDGELLFQILHAYIFTGLFWFLRNSVQLEFGTDWSMWIEASATSAVLRHLVSGQVPITFLHSNIEVSASGVRHSSLEVRRESEMIAIDKIHCAGSAGFSSCCVTIAHV